jgi:hypothetical protein
LEGDELSSDRERADIEVTIHPKILDLLLAEQWLQAREAAKTLQEEFTSGGYQPDGLRVIAGESWSKPGEFIER